MRVERRAIDLKTRETCSVTRAKLDTIVNRLVGMLRKPQAQSLFRQVMVSEVMSQPENPHHVTTADLGGGFAYFSIELGRLLDNQDSGVRTATFEHHCRRSTGKGAADDCHIVIHGEENDAGDRRERQFPADPTTKSVQRTSVILSGVEAK